MKAMRTRRAAARVTAALVGTLATLGAACVFAGAAAAQTPGCSQSGCDFQDPVAEHCVEDSYPVGGVGLYTESEGSLVGYVDLIWSPTCQTNWARVTSFIGPISQTSLKVEIGRESPYGFESLDSNGMLTQGHTSFGSAGTTISLDPNSTSLYTDMLYSPGPAEAIGSVNGISDQFSQDAPWKFPLYPF
jgi:hypothetical protein